MSGINFIIDGQSVSIENGKTILDGANKLGISIPTLCHYEGLKPFTSCMLCVVEDIKTKRLFPSCSMQASDGMEISTDSERVKNQRRIALELLISEHLGECTSPCTRICPASLDIPSMLRAIGKQDDIEALSIVQKTIPFPSILGRICPAPCEKGCRRKGVDVAVTICHLKQFVGDTAKSENLNRIADIASDTAKSVAIIGGGIAGCSAAWFLRKAGHAVTIYESAQALGGAMLTDIDNSRLSADVCKDELELVIEMGATVLFNKQLGKDFSLEDLQKKHDAIVLATGSLETMNLDQFGITCTKRGVSITKGTFATNVSGIFAVGNCVASGKLAVRSLAHGRKAAAAIDQFLLGNKIVGEQNSFGVIIGKLRENDLPAYILDSQSDRNVNMPQSFNIGFTREEAVVQAGRCMRCDCRSPKSCKLRIYCDEYGVSQSTIKPASRPDVTRRNDHQSLVYESGKCIKCGICVRLTEQQGESLGLTFSGRGYDTFVSVPFEALLEKGITIDPEKIAAACPTGALALENGDSPL